MSQIFFLIFLSYFFLLPFLLPLVFLPASFFLFSPFFPRKVCLRSGKLAHQLGPVGAKSLFTSSFGAENNVASPLSFGVRGREKKKVVRLHDNTLVYFSNLHIFSNIFPFWYWRILFHALCSLVRTESSELTETTEYHNVWIKLYWTVVEKLTNRYFTDNSQFSLHWRSFSGGVVGGRRSQVYAWGCLRALSVSVCVCVSSSVYVSAGLFAFKCIRWVGVSRIYTHTSSFVSSKPYSYSSTHLPF